MSITAEALAAMIHKEEVDKLPVFILTESGSLLPLLSVTRTKRRYRAKEPGAAPTVKEMLVLKTK